MTKYISKFVGGMVLWLSLTGAAFAEPQQATIEITGLTCPSCPYIALQAVEAVESVAVIGGEYDEKAQRAVFIVSYDDAATTPAAIAAAPLSYGYPAQVIGGPVIGDPVPSS